MNNFKIYQFNEINTKKIIFGKNQNYEYHNKNTIYIPIYYKNDDKSELVIKTPRLFIKNNIFQYNNNSKNFFLLDTYLMNHYDNDNSNKEFKLFIHNVEKRVKKILTKRKTLDVENKLFTPQLRNNFDNIEKITLPIHKKQTKFINIENNIIEDITTPCYGYFIIKFKNVWINNDKWGININTYGCLLIPSQIEFNPNKNFDIHKSFNDEIDIEKKNILKSKVNNLNEHPVFGKFFKMKKMGIPLMVIEQKIRIQGLDFEEFKKIENNTNTSTNTSTDISINTYTDTSINTSTDTSTDTFINTSTDTSINIKQIPRVNFLAEIKDKKLKHFEDNTIKKKVKDERVPSLNQILEALNKLKKSNCSSTV